MINDQFLKMTVIFKGGELRDKKINLKEKRKKRIKNKEIDVGVRGDIM